MSEASLSSMPDARLTPKETRLLEAEPSRLLPKNEQVLSAQIRRTQNTRTQSHP
jgi:hypothetical protein